MVRARLQLCFCYLKRMRHQYLYSMVSAFKKHNSRWESVRVLMADKNMTERDVLAASFPQAQLLICLYHTFRSFRREVTMDKMGITSGQVPCV